MSDYFVGQASAWVPSGPGLQPAVVWTGVSACPTLVAIVLLASASCVRRVETTTTPRPPAPSGNVTAIMARQAVNAVDAGDGDYRIKALRRRLLADPDNLEVRLELARYYKEQGYTELAAEHYRMAATHLPDDENVHLRLARTLREIDLKPMAAETMEKFVAGHPDASADAQSWLGILEDDIGQFQAGEKAHRAALALDPRRDSLHNNLGYNLLLQGRNEEAAAEFRAALEIAPRSEVARNNLGLALAAKPASKPIDALHIWQSVADTASAHNNLAAVLIEQKRYAEARRELDIALGYKRDHPAVLANLRLVSELDGKPVTIPNNGSSGLLAKIARGFRIVFAGDPQPRGTHTGAAQTASIK